MKNSENKRAKPQHEKNLNIEIFLHIDLYNLNLSELFI